MGKKSAQLLVAKELGGRLATSYFRTSFRRTIIGAAAFHFRVRNGNGWGHCAVITRGPPAAPENRGTRIAERGTVCRRDLWRSPRSLAAPRGRWSVCQKNRFFAAGAVSQEAELFQVPHSAIRIPHLPDSLTSTYRYRWERHGQLLLAFAAPSLRTFLESSLRESFSRLVSLLSDEERECFALPGRA